MSVDKIQCSGYFVKSSDLDYEYKKILKKLKEYGMASVGNKEADRAALVKKEKEMVKDTNAINPNLLTLSVEEQTKILEQKKESKSIENDPRFQFGNSTEGQHLLGEQLYQAILMNNNENSKFNEFKKLRMQHIQ